ncbi:hypothetical protein M9H77_02772 [Catharanthus roseus]|uniref:Uncharacterized protein n=1 Tax=Catharanthus roseus TaxID=4058 RepID=A0ACC0C9B1_CATRO|nr:hypothetical protein M9H77_02772 [Catharanthus roseus]
MTYNIASRLVLIKLVCSRHLVFLVHCLRVAVREEGGNHANVVELTKVFPIIVSFKRLEASYPKVRLGTELTAMISLPCPINYLRDKARRIKIPHVERTGDLAKNLPFAKCSFVTSPTISVLGRIIVAWALTGLVEWYGKNAGDLRRKDDSFRST